jgi:hypothetical protein
LRIHYEAIAKDDVHLRVTVKIREHSSQSVGEVLFVAIKIGKNPGLGAAITTIDSVIHAAVLFDESTNPGVFREPIQRAIIRAGILNDVFSGDGLIGHRGNA